MGRRPLAHPHGSKALQQQQHRGRHLLPRRQSPPLPQMRLRLGQGPTRRLRRVVPILWLSAPLACRGGPWQPCRRCRGGAVGAGWERVC